MSLLRLLHVIVLGLSFTIFTSSIVDAASSRLQKIQDRGVLRVGTTGDWTPMTIRDPATNFYRGFDIDITTELAKDLGVTVDYVATDWRRLVNGIVTEKYDITGSAALNMERARVVGYSDTYFYLAFVPVVNKKDGARFKRWSDFNNPNVLLATKAGTVQTQMVTLLFPSARQVQVQAPISDFQLVADGKATAALSSNIEAASLPSRYPQLMVAEVDGMRQPTPVAMLLPKEDQVWINYINHWIELKKTQGFFDRIAKKWGLVKLKVD